MNRWSMLLVALLVVFAGFATASVAESSADQSDSFGLVDPTSGVWHLYEGAA
jgi:hypothetical protein